MGRTIVVTGGGRSGTREVAERVAGCLSERVLHIITTERMADTVAPAPTSRARWRTTTAPRNLLAALPTEQRETTVLVDCLTAWAANRLVALGDPDGEDWQEDVQRLTTQLVDEVNRVVRRARQGKWSLVLLITEDDGESYLAGRMGYAYSSLLEEISQAARDVADGVYAVVGGLPYPVKRHAALQLI